MLPRFCLILLLLLTIKCKLHAQLCQGSLGDPVVDITFGAGQNPGAPLSAATTNYTYYGADCPNDGSYTVRNQTLNCFGNTWHNLTQDHTGNPNGYFMLVNASFQPSDFYVTTVSGLCPGTTFEFAAWITNMLTPSACGGTGILPNITFSIETTTGTQLATFNSGNIPITASPVWLQYGLYFQTPVGISDVVIRMTNNAPGGCGNDLALDDITFRPCGPLITPFFINTNNDTAINFCLGDTTSLTVGATLSGGYASPQYQWQLSTDNGATFNDIAGATSATYNRLATGLGTYQYRLTVAQQGNIGIATCRVASAPLTVNVNPNPTAAAANNGPKCAGSSVTLTAGGGTSYAWAGPGGFTGNGAAVTVANPAGTGKYYVTVTNSFKCSTVDSTVLTVYPNPVAAFNASLPSCLNSPIDFTNTSTVAVGDSISTYKWLFGDGAGSGAASPPHTFTTAGTYTVTLTVTTEKGCFDSLAQQLTVHYLPQPKFILPKVCLSDPFAQFTDATTIQGGTAVGFTYLWGFGDANAGASNPNSSTLQNPKHSYATTGIYQIKLTVTSSDGCAADTVEPFTVNGAQPQAKLAFNNGSNICSNTALVITNNSTVNFGSITQLDIYWDYSNDTANNLKDANTTAGKQYQTNYPVFDNPATKTYIIKYLAYSGISCMDELDTIITLKASPILVFDTISAVCAGIAPFTLTQAKEANGVGGTGTYSGTAIDSAGLFTPAQATIGTDSIHYTFMAVNGCSAATGQAVKVYAQPTADAGPGRQLLQGGSLTINASANGNNLQYLWAPNMYMDDNTLLMPTVSPPADITYTLTVISSDGCKAEDSMHITVLKTPLIPNAFSPNGDGINDTWVINYLNSYASVTVQVFNRYGQAVFTSNGYNTAWDGTSNGKPLPVGTYYYIIDRKIAGAVKLTGWVAIIR